MPLNTHVRWRGQWAPLGLVSLPAKPSPAPPSGGTFTHGEQISKGVIGPSGTLTLWPGPSTLSGTLTIQDRRFDDGITPAAGANITLVNCRIVGPNPPSNQVVRLNLGGGQRLTLKNCEVIGRGAVNRALNMWDDSQLTAQRTIFRGGLDNAYISGMGGPGAIATGDPLVPNARVLLEECWFGDSERTSGSHSDLVQLDGTASWVVIRRCRFMCYSILVGSDTLIAEADGSTLGSSGLIVTGSSTGVVVRDSWFEGGNYSVDMRGAIGAPAAITGCRFGLAHQYGPLLLPAGATAFDNTWGQTGSTVVSGQTVSVSAGQPL